MNRGQLYGLRPDAVQDPRTHLRAADGRDFAFSNLTNEVLYLDSLLFSVTHRRQSQRFIKQDTAVVDTLINMIVVQFIR